MPICGLGFYLKKRDPRKSRLADLVSQPPKTRWVLSSQLLSSDHAGLTSIAQGSSSLINVIKAGNRLGSLELRRGLVKYFPFQDIFQAFLFCEIILPHSFYAFASLPSKDLRGILQSRKFRLRVFCRSFWSIRGGAILLLRHARLELLSNNLRVQRDLKLCILVRLRAIKPFCWACEKVSGSQL